MTQDKLPHAGSEGSMRLLHVAGRLLLDFDGISERKHENRAPVLVLDLDAVAQDEPAFQNLLTGKLPGNTHGKTACRVGSWEFRPLFVDQHYIVVQVEEEAGHFTCLICGSPRCQRTQMPYVSEKSGPLTEIKVRREGGSYE